MSIYLSQINDDFDNPDGSLAPYYASDLTTTITPRHHWDIRCFNSSQVYVPFSQQDYNFWHGYQYNTFNVEDPRPLDINAGIENWDSGTVGPNATYRYANTLSVSVPTSTTVTSLYASDNYGMGEYGAGNYNIGGGISQVYADDLLTNFNDPNRKYYVELVLRNFPAQGVGVYFDLNNSYIDFSNTPDFSLGVSSIPFSATINNVNAGGDCYLKFPRSMISCDLTRIVGVRFRLYTSGGTATFICQALRLVDDLYTFQVIDTNTRRKELTRSIPQAGGTESSSPYGSVFFKSEKPNDTTYVTSFNSGHADATYDNIIRQFFRQQSSGDNISIIMASRKSQCQITISETLNSVTSTIFQSPAGQHSLQDNQQYFLVTEVIETQARASIYLPDPKNSIELGTLVYSTGWQAITLAGALPYGESSYGVGSYNQGGIVRPPRGYVGYSFEPYNYDFTMQFIGPQTTYFGLMQTTPFNSRKLVRGVTLYPSTSLPVNAISSLTPQAWGDATVSTNSGIITASRDGTRYQGGIVYGPGFFGDTENLTVEGSLWTTASQGAYRLAIIDRYNRVAWMEEIDGILSDTWNDFSIPITLSALPESSWLVLQQSGNYATSFQVRDFALAYNSIAWSVSPDGGVTWYPFFDALNEEFSGVSFPSYSNYFSLRAQATTDNAWIAGYQAVPQYVY